MRDRFLGLRRIPAAAAALAAGTLLAGATTVPAATIAAHFGFDTGFADDSGNAHNGSPTSGTVVTINSSSKKFGAGAADFANPTAGNDYVSLASSPIHFNTATPYALSFWARPTDGTATNDGGMIMGDPANTVSFVWVEEGAGGLRFRSITNANANFALASTTAGGYKDGNFHHYVVQVSALDGDGLINDVSLTYDNIAQTPVKNLADTSLDVKAIGQGYTTALNVAYKGQIDEVWVFNGNLTTGEMSSLFTSNTVPEPSACAAGLLAGAGLLVARRRRRPA